LPTRVAYNRDDLASTGLSLFGSKLEWIQFALPTYEFGQALRAMRPRRVRTGPNGGFDQGVGFLDSWRQDPVLSQVKLIAERRIMDCLSYRVLYFEKHGESEEFIPPDQYHPLALATIGTHDFTSLKGWWLPNDIAIREQHRLYPHPEEAIDGDGFETRKNRSY
jgi:4-alpha-glucanotransferase